MGASEAAFQNLVADLDYPMYIVTAVSGDERAGCLVGFVTQASIAPPRLMVFISKANHTYVIASRAEVLVLHYLSTADFELAQLFGQESGDEVDKFARCHWRAGPHGTPVLHGTRGWIAGRIVDRTDGGDHVGHLLDPFDGDARATSAPLLFSAVKDLQAGHPA